MAVTLTPTAGDAAITAFRIDVTDLPDVTGATKYYIAASEGGNIKGVSHEFAPNSDGDHTWDNYIVPDAGTWVFDVKKVADNVTVQSSGNVTIS